MASSVPTLISNAQTYAASAIAGADAALSTGVLTDMQFAGKLELDGLTQPALALPFLAA